MTGPITILELAQRVQLTKNTVQAHIKGKVYRLDLAVRPKQKGERFILLQGPRLVAYVEYMDAINRAKQLKKEAKCKLSN